MKTSELTGAALDWAVAICDGWREVTTNNSLMLKRVDASGAHTAYRFVEDLPYSQNWGFGGPIIEHELIDLYVSTRSGWQAIAQDGSDAGIPLFQETGPTPLIAAMRVFVSSKLGDEIEIPEELQ